MKKNAEKVVVFVTAPDLATARKLAKAGLEARAIACANLVPRVESHYWWQGKLESAAEVLVIMKTTRIKLAALEKIVLANHPYDTPEIVAMPISWGNGKYLQWLDESTAVSASR